MTDTELHLDSWKNAFINTLPTHLVEAHGLDELAAYWMSDNALVYEHQEKHEIEEIGRQPHHRREE